MTPYQNLKVSYDVWKQIFTNHSSSWTAYQAIAGEQKREILTGNSEYVFSSVVDENSFLDYSSSIQTAVITVSSSDDATALIVAGVADIKEQKRDASGNPIVTLPKMQVDFAPLVAIQGRIGSETIYATHNFCDPTTWYNDSVRIISASLVQSGSFWYHPASGYGTQWVDMKHGKIYDEEGLIEDQVIFATTNGTEAHAYSIHVVVSGVEKTERSPFSTSGGDYTIDYKNGSITPTTEDWTGLPVTASFSRRGTSKYYLEPLPGKMLVIEKSEIQFSKDIEMLSTLVIGVEGYASIFAPQYIQANGGPLPNDARIPLETTLYKSVDQLIDEAIYSYPEIPVLSSGSLRGFQSPRHIFQFHYAAVKKLYSSLGLRVIIFIENDQPYGGERATATFYCTSEKDPGVVTALQQMGLI